MLPTILYTLVSLGVGGVELRTLELFAALKARYPDLRITLYVTSGQGGPLSEDFSRLGIDIVYGRGGAAGLPHFFRTCRRCKPDILHSNHSLASGLHAMAATALGVRYRYVHMRTLGDEWSGWRGAVKRCIGRTLVRRFSTRVIGVTDAARHYARAVPKQWLTIHEGVIYDRQLPVTPARAPTASRALRILMLGRISPEKNCLRAIAILEALHRQGVATTLRYIGPATVLDKAMLARAIRASPSRIDVQVDAPSRDPLGAIRSADILLLPSLREGLPGVVLEALSQGKPVVASDLPGLREMRAAVAGISLVGLDESDARWATTVRNAAATADARAIADSFARGPFSFEKHVESFIVLWRLPPVQPAHASAMRAVA